MLTLPIADANVRIGPLVHQRGLDRDADRFGAVVDADLGQHVGPVDFDRTRADAESVGDQAVGQTAGDA